MVEQVGLAARVVDLANVFGSISKVFKFGTRIAPPAVRCHLPCDQFAAARLYNKIVTNSSSVFMRVFQQGGLDREDGG